VRALSKSSVLTASISNGSLNELQNCRVVTNCAECCTADPVGWGGLSFFGFSGALVYEDLTAGLPVIVSSVL